MNKQNQIQIYLVSILFSFFYFIIFTPNGYAVSKNTKDKEQVDSGLIVFNYETSTNEFPRTVGTLSREKGDEGLTILEWKDNNTFGFLDNIAELFNIFSSNDNVATNKQVNNMFIENKIAAKQKNTEIIKLSSNEASDASAKVVDRSRVYTKEK